MKQIIVMVAMVALGVLIAGLVMDFGDSAQSLANEANAKITYTEITK